MVIFEAPYFDGYKTNPQDFVNWMNGRGDHGSVQLGFAQPATDSTKSGYQLSDPSPTGQRVGSDWTVLSGSGRVSIGVGSGRNLPDLAENWADLAEIWRIWPKTSFVW